MNFEDELGYTTIPCSANISTAHWDERKKKYTDRQDDESAGPSYRIPDHIAIPVITEPSEGWSIYKVPFRLRQVNEKAYEPRLISIGPYHHGKDHLKMMETIKDSCLSRIIGGNMSMAEALLKAVTDMKKDVRKCYSEDFDMGSNFGKMMICDGCFIVDLFRKIDKRKKFLIVNEKREKAQFLELNGILTEICCDLLLLENQLPFSVLSKLYGLINTSNDETDEFARSALNFLELVLPGPVRFPTKFPENIKHLLGLVHYSWIPQRTGGQDQGLLSKFIRCATELEEAGVKIEKKDNGEDDHGVGSSLFDIAFTAADAKLKIPTINIDNNTEFILRNFMAYEQFIPMWEPTYVCDYVVFMDNLIDSGKDVQLLRHSGVIVNWFGDDEAAAQMFNKLRDFAYSTQHSFYYKKIYDEVDKHCQIKWNKWKAKLKKDYFNSPWSFLSVVAAGVLLLLTMAQTIFSVASYANPL